MCVWIWEARGLALLPPRRPHNGKLNQKSRTISSLLKMCNISPGEEGTALPSRWAASWAGCCNGSFPCLTSDSYIRVYMSVVLEWARPGADGREQTLLYFHFIPIFIEPISGFYTFFCWARWERLFSHAWWVLSLRPHSLQFQKPTLSNVPPPGLFGNVSILSGTHPSKVGKAASRSQMASLCAHTPRCS